MRLSCSLAITIFALTGPALAQTADERPPIQSDRSREDWSALADPDVAREPLDSLKYVPLSTSDPDAYLSFGANFRARYEYNGAPLFGADGGNDQSYVIDRLQVHADLRLFGGLQVFTQLESEFAPGKTSPAPSDRNRLDLEQAFVGLSEPLAGGVLHVRAGRQEFGFDAQRFVSLRDGPNVRQAHDALWVDYESGRWRFISFYSQPVQYRDHRAFDDFSNGHFTFGGVRVERRLFEDASLTAYVAQFRRDGVEFPSGSGNETRNVFDVRFAGASGSFDWDLETMAQAGHVGQDSVRAWAIGARAGHTFHQAAWAPRLGLQIDAASGDRDPNDARLETFNALFPRGSYLTLAGYSGYSNFVHVKPSLTLQPAPSFTALIAVAGQWRETTADAVYAQPNTPLPNTSGQDGKFTGSYLQTRLDWQVGTHVAFAVEGVHFMVSDPIRAAGGHDSDYVSLEVKLGW